MNPDLLDELTESILDLELRMLGRRVGDDPDNDTVREIVKLVKEAAGKTLGEERVDQDDHYED